MKVKGLRTIHGQNGVEDDSELVLNPFSGCSHGVGIAICGGMESNGHISNRQKENLSKISHMILVPCGEPIIKHQF
jgi:hypothetical protein